jgi:fucose 4-O-acetylase-like acetyltransferase
VKKLGSAALLVVFVVGVIGLVRTLFGYHDEFTQLSTALLIVVGSSLGLRAWLRERFASRSTRPS